MTFDSTSSVHNTEECEQQQEDKNQYIFDGISYESYPEMVKAKRSRNEHMLASSGLLKITSSRPKRDAKEKCISKIIRSSEKKQRGVGNTKNSKSVDSQENDRSKSSRTKRTSPRKNNQGNKKEQKREIVYRDDSEEENEDVTNDDDNDGPDYRCDESEEEEESSDEDIVNEPSVDEVREIRKRVIGRRSKRRKTAKRKIKDSNLAASEYAGAKLVHCNVRVDKDMVELYNSVATECMEESRFLDEQGTAKLEQAREMAKEYERLREMLIQQDIDKKNKNKLEKMKAETKLAEELKEKLIKKEAERCEKRKRLETGRMIKKLGIGKGEIAKPENLVLIEKLGIDVKGMFCDTGDAVDQAIPILEETEEDVREREYKEHKSKLLNSNELEKLLDETSVEVNKSLDILFQARTMATKAGLTVDSSVLDPAYQTPLIPFSYKVSQSQQHQQSISSSAFPSFGLVPQKATNEKEMSTAEHQKKYGLMRGNIAAFPLILETTQGHSNTDHVVQFSGDPRADRIAEFKRALKRRARTMQPEERGEERWDKPRESGGRRRRIIREKDFPSAPPEPPTSGYVSFIAQLTQKVRHDNPNKQHDQIKVVREISKIWRYGMSNSERNYYVEMAREAREFYNVQIKEYRATGSYRQSQKLGRLLGTGPWIQLDPNKQNKLEKELAAYTKVIKPGEDRRKVHKRGLTSRERALHMLLNRDA